MPQDMLGLGKLRRRRSGNPRRRHPAQTTVTFAHDPKRPYAVSGAARQHLYRILIRDLVVPWRVGIHKHEKEAPQPVRLNLDLEVREPENLGADEYREVVCYERIVERIRDLAGQGHVKLVETLADRIIELCLADTRVERVTVRVEKLGALADTASVGIEVTRERDEGALKLAVDR